MSPPAPLRRFFGWTEAWEAHGLWAPGVWLMRRLTTRAKISLPLTFLLVTLALLLNYALRDLQTHLAAVQDGRVALRQIITLVDASRRTVALTPPLAPASAPVPASADLQAQDQAVAALLDALNDTRGPNGASSNAAARARLTARQAALRTSLTTPTTNPARRQAGWALLREFIALRAEMAPAWRAISATGPANELVYEGTVEPAARMLPLIGSGLTAGASLLAEPQSSGAMRRLTETLATLKLHLAVAEPQLDRLTAGGVLEPKATTAAMSSIQHYVAHLDRLLDHVTDAPNDGATDLSVESLNTLSRQAAEGAYTIQRQGLITLDARLAAQSDAAHHQQWLLLTSVALSLAAAAYTMFCAYRVINKGLTVLVERIECLGRGDLSAPHAALGKDEIGHAIDKLGEAVTHLRGLFETVTQGVAAVSHASREVAQGNAGLSSRTGDMRQSIGLVAGGAQGSASAMDACADAVERANEHAQSARASARLSSKSMAALQSRMRDMAARSREINQVVSLMETVSFQTKLLSLNASVEAARAGESGKGFAVVAQEVRALAVRSSHAAESIRRIVGASVSDIEQGSQLATSANAAMRDTDQEIQSVNQLMSEVVQLTRDGMAQSQSVLEIARTVESSVASNVQLIDQLSDTAGALREQGDTLRQSTRHFVLV